MDGVVLYVEDVTERHRQEEVEKLGRVKLMLDHAHQLSMALFDASGVLLHASEQYLEMVKRFRGVESETALGVHWDQLWFGGEESRGAFDEVLRGGKPVRRLEVHAVDGGVDSVWDCTLIPITSEPDGPVTYVVLTAVEVTRPVLARQALEQLDRLKDSFLSLASHELRTPLTPLAAYVELLAHLLAEKRRDPEWERQMNDVIVKFRRQIGYMSRITEDLVDISRIRSGHLTLDLKPVDLRSIVEEGRDQALMLGSGADVELDVERDGTLMVDADETRLTQVVSNLLANSLRHAPNSDRVRLRLGALERDGRRWGRVEVEDAGPGIPESYREDLFQRFLNPQPQEGRTARSGLGLGLYISARIVEQHGGRIDVEHLQPGTRIYFELPLRA